MLEAQEERVERISVLLMYACKMIWKAKSEKRERRTAQQDPEEVLMQALMAAGGQIPNDMADRLVEEGIASTKNMIIFDKDRIVIIANRRARKASGQS